MAELPPELAESAEHWDRELQLARAFLPDDPTSARDRVAGAAGGYSLLALHPRTGRTHQIRAHLAYLHLPIAGDLRYGGGIGPGGLQRQFLHASRIALQRPSDGRRLHAWSELPADLAASLETAGITVQGLPVGVGSAVEGDEADPGSMEGW